MKIKSKFHYAFLCMALFVNGCNHSGDETVPEQDCINLSLIGEINNNAEGIDNVIFKWESIASDFQEESKLSFMISDGHHVIPTKESDEQHEDDIIYGNTLIVTPHESHDDLAYLQTVRPYLKDDLEHAAYCYSVSGNVAATEDVHNGQCMHLNVMPSEFTQVRNSDPGFLRDFMYMYAASEYNAEQTILNYNHIPALLRFIICNDSPMTASLRSVSLQLQQGSSQENAIGSSSVSVTFDWTECEVDLSYGEASCERVTTVMEGDDRILNPGSTYVAYSMVLPLVSDEAFKDKILEVILKTDESDDIVVQLVPEELAMGNTGVFNWIGGSSYSIGINVGSDGKAHGYILPDNVIEVSAKNPGVYTLMYEGIGGHPLQDYAEICTLEINGQAYYEDFIDANVAPREAESIGIYDAGMTRFGGISVAGLKPEYTDPLYSFGVLSDVHVVPDNKVGCIDNFLRALTFFNDKSVDFVCVCGDISEKGTAEEYSLYKQIVSEYSPSIPVYTTTGNHDCQSGGINVDDWKEYTGNDIVFEFSHTLADGSVDHFLFLGMSYWSSTKAYLEENIDWLDGKLNEYLNERCFVITHMFFPDRAGNMNQVYPPGNWLSGSQLTRLQSLCDAHVNSVWFSGHSHWKWYLQKFDDKANVFRLYDGDAPASGWCVHIPSCSKPQDSNGLPRGEKGSRVEKSDESEGAIINVYENHIDILGLDLKNLKYLPIASYRLDLM